MAKDEKKKSTEIAVTFVRNKRTSIQIKWNQGGDAYEVTFHDNPRKSFYASIAALPEHVAALCEFPAKDAQKIEATGVTIANPGESPSAVIIAKKKVLKGKRIFNIATPLLPLYENDDPNATGDFMEEETAKAIEKVLTEAKKYILGDREQGQIEFVDEEAEKKQKKDDNQVEFPAAAEGTN